MWFKLLQLHFPWCWLYDWSVLESSHLLQDKSQVQWQVVQTTWLPPAHMLVSGVFYKKRLIFFNLEQHLYLLFSDLATSCLYERNSFLIPFHPLIIFRIVLTVLHQDVDQIYSLATSCISNLHCQIAAEVVLFAYDGPDHW